MDPEEIAAVIPIEEEPELMKKAAQIIKEKPKEPVKDDKKGNESPLKRRVTLMPPKTKGSNQL